MYNCRPLEILGKTAKCTQKKLRCSYGLDMGEEGDAVYGTISITMNDTKGGADVSIVDDNNILYRDHLIVKSDDGNDFYLYASKNKKKKAMNDSIMGVGSETH
jgi:hypothetical protein